MIGAPILPGLIGAIVAGKMAESSKQAFGGWMLTPLISAAVLVVFAFQDPSLNTNVLFINMVLSAGLLLLLLSAVFSRELSSVFRLNLMNLPGKASISITISNILGRLLGWTGFCHLVFRIASYCQSRY